MNIMRTQIENFRKLMRKVSGRGEKASRLAIIPTAVTSQPGQAVNIPSGFSASEDSCANCGGTGWSALPSNFCPVCWGSGVSKPAETDYNKLEPPSNVLYPWQPKGWQPLCYYCCEPIRITTPEAMYRQRVHFNWDHVNPATSGGHWIIGSFWHCDPAKIRKDIDPPRCHICGTQTSVHANICSAAGRPPYHATTMSQKEEEVSRVYGKRANAAAI